MRVFEFWSQQERDVFGGPEIDAEDLSDSADDEYDDDTHAHTPQRGNIPNPAHPEYHLYVEACSKIPVARMLVENGLLEAVPAGPNLPARQLPDLSPPRDPEAQRNAAVGPVRTCVASSLFFPPSYGTRSTTGGAARKSKAAKQRPG